MERVVVVVGASAGVGRAVALAFARRGATLALVARDAEALAEVAAEAEGLGSPRALVLPLDIAEADAVTAAARRVDRELGPIDVWVNAAMVTVYSEIRRLAPEELRRVTEVTYLGNAYGIMAALEHMMPRDRGVIVQVGSALAYRSIPLQSAYCGAKAALRGFVDSLRSELIHHGSRVAVTMVQLPAVNTPQFDWARCHLPRMPRPVAPVFQPEDVAEEIVAAAERPAREVWIGNPTRKAIIGTMAAPGLADRFAEQAWAGQMDERPLPRDRPDNLFEPVRGMHRTRGRFDAEARPAPVDLSGASTRAIAAAAGVALVAGIAATAGAGLLGRRR
jgi:short-subunit dehydrogenase